MGMTTTQTETLRKRYKALMTAALAGRIAKANGYTAERFNRDVQSVAHERADGEPYEMTAAMYWDCAQEAAHTYYGVDYRNVAGCQ